MAIISADIDDSISLKYTMRCSVNILINSERSVIIFHIVGRWCKLSHGNSSSLRAERWAIFGPRSVLLVSLEGHTPGCCWCCWCWMLVSDAGVGCWCWMLVLNVGAGCWILVLDTGAGCWCWIFYCFFYCFCYRRRKLLYA